MKSYKVKWLALWLIAGVLSILPFYNMVIKGVYRWHIHQPEVYQGIIELSLFAAVTFMVIVIRKRHKTVEICLLFAGIYLLKQGVLIPLVADCIYIEILMFIGSSFSRYIVQDRKSATIFTDFIIGMSLFGAVEIVCSLLGYGTINDLRIALLLLLVVAIIHNHNQDYCTILKRVQIFGQEKVTNNRSTFFFIAIVFVFAILCAKSNTNLDYDSLWYGLRPEEVLVGKHSFYDYLGYTSFVHYYPKFMELLYLPISGLGDYSFIIVMNICCLGMIANVIYSAFDRWLPQIETENKLFFVFMFSSIPAVANISATAKPDILGCFLVLAGSYYGLSFFFGDNRKLVLAYISLLLCTGTKLTYLVWGGSLFLFITFIAIVRCIKHKKTLHEILQSAKQNILAIIGAVITILGVHYRTFKLTGYPIYPLLVGLQSKIGFKPRNFALFTSNSLGNEEYNAIYRLYQMIIDPTGLPHVIMLWTSNVLVYSILLYALYGISFKRNERRKQYISLISYLVVLVFGIMYFVTSMTNPDGNYFIMPIIFVSIVIFISLIAQYSWKSIRHAIYPMYVLIGVNLVIMMVSHSSWAYGTKAIDSIMVSDNFDTDERNAALLQYHGLQNTVSFLESNLPEGRVISSVFSDSSIPRRIHSGIETIDQIASSYFNDGSIMQSYDSFVAYLEHAHIDALLISSDETGSYSEYVAQLLNENRIVLVAYDENAYCYLVNK